jgi:hypothetical protein
MWDILEGEIEPDRKVRIEEEKAEIAQLETGDAIVKFIRNDYDIANRETLCKKFWPCRRRCCHLCCAVSKPAFRIA